MTQRYSFFGYFFVFVEKNDVTIEKNCIKKRKFAVSIKKATKYKTLKHIQL